MTTTHLKKDDGTLVETAGTATGEIKVDNEELEQDANTLASTVTSAMPIEPFPGIAVRIGNSITLTTQPAAEFAASAPHAGGDTPQGATFYLAGVDREDVGGETSLWALATGAYQRGAWTVDQGAAGAVDRQWFVVTSDGVDPHEIATEETLAEILSTLPRPAITGSGRVAPYRSLLYIAHDPGDMTSLGGNVAFNARCDFALVGGGSLVYLSDRRAVRLAVGTASGDVAAYRQRIWNPAIPGTVQHVKFACPFGPAQTNQEKRVGTFDDSDGVYVLQTSSDVLLGIRSSVSGSPLETTTTIPGLDPTLDHILEIRYLWPAGGVEVWSDGELLLFVPKSGGAESPWMRRPNLPFSVEVRNTGASSAGHVDVIYADVHSEGSDTIQQRNVVFSVTATTIPTTGKLLAQARVKSSFDLGTITGIPNRNVYHPHKITIETANGPMIIRCYANGTVGGTPSWTAAPTDPGIEYDNAGTFVGADGVLFAIGTIDDTVGTCVIDFTDAFSAFAVSAGAYFGPETLQIVGFARTGNVSSATVTIEAHKIGG